MSTALGRLGLTASTVSGTPTKAGTHSIKLKVTDQSGTSVKKRFKLKIWKALGLKTETLEAAKAAKKYQPKLKAVGGRNRSPGP
jgi:hypothetical protein